MTNNSIREDLLTDSFNSTSSSNSSLSSSSQTNVQQMYASSFNSCSSDPANGGDDHRNVSLSELFKKSEHQLGDTNFKFFKYNPRVTTYSIAISSILTLSVFAYMILFREQMFIFSLEFIEDMQSNRNIFITSFMNFISLCVSPKPVISLLVIFFALSTQKLKILTFLLYYGFLVYTCVTLKSLFGDPRPYWIESSVDVTPNIAYVNQTSQIRLLQFSDPLNPDMIDQQSTSRKELHYDYFSNIDHRSNIENYSDDQKQFSFNNSPENIQLRNTFISEESQAPEIEQQAKNNSDSFLSSHIIGKESTQIQQNSTQHKQDQDQNSNFSGENVNSLMKEENFQSNNKYPNTSDNEQPILIGDKTQSNEQKNRQIPLHNRQILTEVLNKDPHQIQSNNPDQLNEQEAKGNQYKDSSQNTKSKEQIKNQNLSNISSDASVLPLEWKCYQEYGNPSGHAFLGVPLYEFIVRDYILRKIGKDQRILRTLVAISAVILVNLIFLSRMYLGMHSLNQVIFGCVLGIYATVFYRLFFEMRISAMLYKYVQLKRSNAIKEVVQVIILTLLIFSFPIIIYAIQEFALSESPELQSQMKEWEAVILQKCGNFDRMQSFHHKCFIDSSVVAIGFSIVLGFLLTSRERFLKGQYKETPGLKYFFVRVCIILSICSIIAIFYYVFPNYNNPYVKYFYLFIGTFLTGFLLVACVPKLFEKYKLITIICPLLEEQLNGLNIVSKQQYPLSESINSMSSKNPSQTEIPNHVLNVKEICKS